jgi:hypothetical protein
VKKINQGKTSKILEKIPAFQRKHPTLQYKKFLLPFIISFRLKYLSLDTSTFCLTTHFFHFLIREQQQIFKNLDEKDGKIDRKISRKDLTDWVQQQSAPSLLSLDTEDRKLSR